MSQCHTGSQWKLWRKKNASFLPKTQINRLWLPTLNQVSWHPKKLQPLPLPRVILSFSTFTHHPGSLGSCRGRGLGWDMLGQLDGSKNWEFVWFSSQKHGNFHVLIHHILYWLLCLWCLISFQSAAFVACVFLESQKPRLPQVWAIGWCSRSSSSLGLAKESSRGPGWRHFQDKIEVKVQEDSFEIS